MAELALIMHADMDSPTPGQRDGRLLALARGGDLPAFETLLRQYERRVLGTAYRLLGGLEDAQDAAQEVFLRLHRSLGGIDKDRELGAWLYRVTVNVCHDIGRRRRSRQTSSLDLLRHQHGLDPPSNASSPEQETLGLERRRLIQEGLRTLPQKERAAVVLRDIQGLPAPEVARILGSSEATVRSQISSARVKLKQWMERRERTRKS